MMRPSGPVPLMRVASMTEYFASAAARGLMRNSDGAAGAGRGATGTTTGVAVGAETTAAMGARGAAGAAIGAAGAGAVPMGIGSPELPRNPTVLWTGTLTRGGTVIFN